jgi:hypothetical protein
VPDAECRRQQQHGDEHGKSGHAGLNATCHRCCSLSPFRVSTSPRAS